MPQSTENMLSMQKYSLCRLCLCMGALFDIFDEEIKLEFILKDTIEDLIRCEVEKEEGFPWLICGTCQAKLTEFRLFKRRCLECKQAFDIRFRKANLLAIGQNDQLPANDSTEVAVDDVIDGSEPPNQVLVNDDGTMCGPSWLVASGNLYFREPEASTPTVDVQEDNLGKSRNGTRPDDGPTISSIIRISREEVEVDNVSMNYLPTESIGIEEQTDMLIAGDAVEVPGETTANSYLKNSVRRLQMEFQVQREDPESRETDGQVGVCHMTIHRLQSHDDEDIQEEASMAVSAESKVPRSESIVTLDITQDSEDWNESQEEGVCHMTVHRLESHDDEDIQEEASMAVSAEIKVPRSESIVTLDITQDSEDCNESQENEKVGRRPRIPTSFKELSDASAAVLRKVNIRPHWWLDDQDSDPSENVGDSADQVETVRERENADRSKDPVQSRKGKGRILKAGRGLKQKKLEEMRERMMDKKRKWREETRNQRKKVEPLVITVDEEDANSKGQRDVQQGKVVMTQPPKGSNSSAHLTGGGQSKAFLCCCASLCQNTKWTQGVHFARIPKDLKRGSEWLRRAGRSDLLALAPEMWNKLYRLCWSHFDPSMFSPSGKMVPSAMPTIFSFNTFTQPTPLWESTDSGGNSFVTEEEGLNPKNENDVPVAVEIHEDGGVWEGVPTKPRDIKPGRKKSCFVPMCPNKGHRNSGKRFIAVPKDERRKMWLQAAGLPQTYTFSNMHCCEDHFELEEDFLNYNQSKYISVRFLRPKPDTVPRYFDCQANRQSTHRPKSEGTSKMVEHKKIIHELLNGSTDISPEQSREPSPPVPVKYEDSLSMSGDVTQGDGKNIVERQADHLPSKEPFTSTRVINDTSASSSVVTATSFHLKLEDPEDSLLLSNVNLHAIIQPTINQLAVHQPASHQPAINQLAIHQPAFHLPDVDQPAIIQPAINQPDIDQSAVSQPAVDQLAFHQPVSNSTAVKNHHKHSRKQSLHRGLRTDYVWHLD